LHLTNIFDDAVEQGLIFLHTKLDLWNRLLASTMTSQPRPAVNISRPRALKAREKGDPEGKNSVFGQAFRQLHFLPPDQLRQVGDLFCADRSAVSGILSSSSF
jgi:hypothetical protein